MIVARPARLRFLPRLVVSDYLALRGLILSHAMGVALFVPMLLNRVFRFDLGYFFPVDVPILAIGTWLILERRGRLGSIRIGLVDYLYLGFVALQAFSFVYADTWMMRFTGFQNYLESSVTYLRPYLYYLIVRESLNRRGFRPEIMLYWLLAAWTASALIGLMQARNLFGVREWSYRFYNQYAEERTMVGPSQPWQAKGAMPHANSLAHTMWLGLAIVVGFAWHRRLKWFELACGVILFAALIATYSRSGVIVVVAMAAALVVFMFVRKRYWQATVGLVLSGLLLILGIMGVYAFNVERFKPIIEGEGAVQGSKLGTFYGRMENARRAIVTGSKSPVFGVAPVGTLINNINMVVHNEYSFEGKLDNDYTLTWVNYGFIGILFLIVWLVILWRPIIPQFGQSSFAVTTFLMGTGYLVHFVSENLIFKLTAIVPMSVLALVHGRYVVADAKKAV